MLGGSRFLQQPQAAPSGTKPFLLLPAELEKAPKVAWRCDVLWALTQAVGS